MMSPGMNLEIVLQNFFYAIIGTLIGLILMYVSYKIMNKIVFRNFDLSEELENHNVAVGIVLGAVFLGVAVLAGMCVGMALN